MNERIEILVKRKTPVVMKVTVYVLAILAVFLIYMFGIFAILFSVAAGGFAWFFGVRSNIEYEYTYFDKELDVDVIYSMQKRKHIITYDLAQLEVMAPRGSYHLDSYKNRDIKAKDFSTRIPENEGNVYVMYLAGSQKVIFEPTPELVKAIANIAPRKVFTE